MRDSEARGICPRDLAHKSRQRQQGSYRIMRSYSSIGRASRRGQLRRAAAPWGRLQAPSPGTPWQIHGRASKGLPLLHRTKTPQRRIGFLPASEKCSWRRMGNISVLEAPAPSWGEGSVMETDHARAKARQNGDTIHFGRICELCHEKGSDGDPGNKRKGRLLLLGDHVRDQYFNWAVFCELGSSPPSTEAVIALDAIGSLPGYRFKTGDARGAYAQSLLRGVKTWATPPAHRWQKHCIGTPRRPGVPLILALYGHADAGGSRE